MRFCSLILEIFVIEKVRTEHSFVFLSLSACLLTLRMRKVLEMVWASSRLIINDTHALFLITIACCFS